MLTSAAALLHIGSRVDRSRRAGARATGTEQRARAVLQRGGRTALVVAKKCILNDCTLRHQIAPEAGSGLAGPNRTCPAKRARGRYRRILMRNVVITVPVPA